MRGSSFKQIKLSQSLENTENCTLGFVLLASVKSSCSNCLREKSQLFWSLTLPAVVVLYFTASEKDNLRTESYSYKEQKLSQCTGKQNYVLVLNEKWKKLWLFSLESWVSLLVLFFVVSLFSGVGFVLLASVNCLREKSQLFWSLTLPAVVVLYFTASEKDNFRTESYSYKEQKLSQFTGKQNYVMKNEKELWLLLLDHQKNDPE